MLATGVCEFTTGNQACAKRRHCFLQLGHCFVWVGAVEEALTSYDQAIVLDPRLEPAYNNRGSTLHALGRFDAALTSYDRALELQTDSAETHCNRGVTLAQIGRVDDALASYDRALALKPVLSNAHWNQAICCLSIGDFERGWEKYEWRWSTEHFRLQKREFARPLWDGSQQIAGKCILLHAEQGFGDTIQFCRYVPMVAELGAKVILEVQQPLKRLLSGFAGAQTVLARGEPLPRFDLHCPLLSLPRAFATRLETIPPLRVPLRAPPELARKWKEKLGPEGQAAHRDRLVRESQVKKRPRQLNPTKCNAPAI